jgi:hypothetical protein
MTTYTPDLKTFRIAGAKASLGIAAAITDVKLDATEGSIAQLSVEAVDPSGMILRSSLATAGTAIQWGNDIWEVGATTTSWNTDNTITHSFDCRSTLARKLRKTFTTSVEKKVSPSDWVTRRVRQAGGRAVCQPTSKQATIAQTSGKQRQSSLDVIGSLAGELEWTWVEWGNVLYFGSRHWAWSGGPAGQRNWQVNWLASPNSDAISAELTLDSDDVENKASGSVTVPYDYGVKMRPWDRIRLGGFGTHNGIYLIDAVSITADTISPITLKVSQPNLPAKKSGSS